MSTIDLKNPPERYWHCSVTLSNQKNYYVVNDLSFEELNRNIVTPWQSGQLFTVGGAVVHPGKNVEKIRIAYTPQPKDFYARERDIQMSQRRINDWTDRGLLPIKKGTDLTNELIFSGIKVIPPPNVEMVSELCRRLPHAARILSNRPRKDKTPFKIEDEYDVQDLLQAILRAYLKYSVQENPLPRVANAKSGRADISIEELGTLIEIKFARNPEDQKRIFTEYTEDLELYSSWPHLKNLVYLIYNSVTLRDPEAFDKFSGPQERNGKRFHVIIVRS